MNRLCGELEAGIVSRATCRGRHILLVGFAALLLLPSIACDGTTPTSPSVAGSSAPSSLTNTPATPPVRSMSATPDAALAFTLPPPFPVQGFAWWDLRNTADGRYLLIKQAQRLMVYRWTTDAAAPSLALAWENHQGADTFLDAAVLSPDSR